MYLQFESKHFNLDEEHVKADVNSWYEKYNKRIFYVYHKMLLNLIYTIFRL